ncbi:lantibiotic immunity ABC transporter MutE/EpiE family permease subunit [Aneurinibacillus thermoaerophilus]|uniref:lantibiotic immunity ABC transporter MutE/EpiE family permease subunit n=1 Tax=Aneurinibacillus thermoaerophilus TaxID=143495 RepID=UPI002E21D061|nr:lantibiotic immunity ABC transporter MutE/EpiE family permease subunit [Aneurinibacillus thermoaerophilus]MED0762948.1 lantibiotic immunity ABC transporter MutE/EpiE family permease subunit [Aneurinibacillus thermoaerophilus]
MMKMVASERLKYKRSFAKKLALTAPLFFVLYGAVIRFYLPDQSSLPWELLLSMIFNWWPVLFIPVGIALLCTLAENREKKAGNYRSLRSNNISIPKLWFSKIIVIGYYMLASSIVLMFAAVAAGLLTAGGDVPLADIIGSSLLIWLVSLSLIPIHLFAAVRFGAFGGLALGVAGIIAGVLAADRPVWIVVPWSWPIRLMSPLIGVHPNGVRLDLGDPLLDPSVIPEGIATSLLFLAVFSALTAYWFARREVR